MPRSSGSSLRGRVLALVLLAVAPAWILVVAQTREQRELAVRAVRVDATRVMQLARADQVELIEGARSALTVLADSPEVRAQGAECSRFLAGLLERFPLYTNLGFADPEGNVTCSGVPPPGSVNIADRPYFQDALSTGEFSVGVYQVGRITGVPSVNFGYPVPAADGSIRGVAFVALDLGLLNRFERDADLPPETSLTLVDVEGTVLARYPDAASAGQPLAEAGLLRALRSGRTGTIELGGAGDPRILYAYGPLPGSAGPSAFVAVGIPVEAAYAHASQTLTRDLLVLAIIALLAVGAAWFVGGAFFIGPVRRVIAATERLATGDLTARAELAGRIGELAPLGRSFDAMAASLEQQAARLQTSADRLSNLHEIDREIMAATSPEEVAETALGGLERLIPFQSASVLLFEAENHVARVLAVIDPESHGPLPGSLLGLEALSPPEAPTAMMPSFHDDLHAETSLPPLHAKLSERGIRSLMTFPLGTTEGVVGELSFAATSAEAFEDEHRQIAQEVAGALAIALAQARMRQELAERAEELEGRFHDLRRTEAHRRELLGRLATAQEEERRRIAEDIHDDSVQVMIAASMRLETLRRRLTEPEQLRQLAEIQATVQKSIARLRHLLFVLTPEELGEGLAPAIRRCLDETFADGGIDRGLENLLGEEPPPETRIVAYRVAQTALANVRAHAGAGSVRVTLAEREGGLLVRVVDDGVGFHMNGELEDRPGHLGLRSMRERAELAGGRLVIQTAPGEGTTVEVWLPIEARTSRAR